MGGIDIRNPKLTQGRIKRRQKKGADIEEQGAVVAFECPNYQRQKKKNYRQG